ncbi:MAG: HEPN domain-containing protein [Phormidesmis sp.]
MDGKEGCKQRLVDFDRWYRQSVDDLEAARALLSLGKYIQSCQYAQQAACTSLNALLIFVGDRPYRSYDCESLIQTLPSTSSRYCECLSCSIGAK